MVVDDITYDIDNRDIEHEMYIQDLEEEQEEQDITDEELEDTQEETEKTYYQTRRTINTKNLDLDLGIEVEQLRPIYLWESLKDGQTYEGCVVHKFDNNSYIFNASIKGANEFKLKKFTLNNIKQIKK